MPTPDESAKPMAVLTIDGAGEVSPLIAAIDDAVDAQRELEHRLRGEFGTNNTDFRALLLVFRLRRRGHPAHPSDLTRGLGISSGTASQVIARLGQAQLLERAPDPADARAGLLTLTDAAAQRLASSTEAVRNDLDRILASVDDPEEARLIDLLEQVRDVLIQHRGPA